MAVGVEEFQIGHIRIAVDTRPDWGLGFSLYAGVSGDPKHSAALFTGFLFPGMADQLRALADRIDALEENRE